MKHTTDLSSITNQNRPPDLKSDRPWGPAGDLYSVPSIARPTPGHTIPIPQAATQT